MKELNVIFLQETHSNQRNEFEWRLWWEGEHVLSHGTNLSAGVAVLFSPAVKAKILLNHELEPGRLLIVRAEINSFCFLFVNIYAPNTGPDRIKLFIKLKLFLRQNQNGDFIVLGGIGIAQWTLHLIEMGRSRIHSQHSV